MQYTFSYNEKFIGDTKISSYLDQALWWGYLRNSDIVTSNDPFYDGVSHHKDYYV